MATLLKSAQVLAVASTLSTTTIAGQAQVLPLGTLSLAPSTIVDSPAFHAKRAAERAEQRLRSQRFCCTADGIVTTPELLEE